MISLIVLVVVFLLIAVRQVGNLRLQIWQIMSLGAVAVLATGQITPLNALGAINLDVLLFLFGMFVVGETLTFLEFVKIGIPLTVVNTAVYWLFFTAI